MLLAELIPVVMADDSAYEAGYNTGRMIVATVIPLLLLIGIVKCIKIMRRPATSGLCVASLLAFLILFFISSIISAFRTEGESLPMLLSILSVLSLVLGVIAGIVFGILGLVDYARRKEHLVQGRKQAIWGLVLNGLVLLAFAGGVVYGAVSQTLRQNAVPMEAIEDAGKEREFEEFNFKFRMPTRPWVSVKPTAFNADSALCLNSVRPQRVFTIIAESLGVDAGITRESLVEISKANVESAGQSVEFGEVSERKVNGIEFLRFASMVRGVAKQGDKYYYEHWVAVQNGYYYQLVTFTFREEKDALARTAEELAGRFEILDPDRIAYGLSGRSVQPVDYPTLGFRVDLSGEGWTEWESADVDYPEAQFAAIKGSTLGFGVVALDLEELDPDLDALAYGMLGSLFTIDYPDSVDSPRPIESGIAKGYAIDARRNDSSGDFTYRFRVLRADRHAWLLSAWLMTDAVDRVAELDEALDQVEIYAPDPAAEKPEWPERIAQGSAAVVNKIGLDYHRRNAYATGLPYYRAAYRMDGKTPQYLENILDSLWRTGEPEEGLAYADKEMHQFPEHLLLRVYRAYFLSGLERSDEAIGEYEKVFEAGYDDSDDLLTYLNLLVDEENQEKAVEEVRKFRKRTKSSGNELDRWEASLLGQLEKHDEALALLEAALEKHPSSATVAFSLCSALLDAERYSDALERADALIESGNESADAYLFKGRSELGLEWIRKARTSFEKARESDSDNEAVEYYLNYTSAALGKGNTASVKNPIDPVAMPDEVAALMDRLEEEHGSQLGREHGFQVLRKAFGQEFVKGSRLKKTTWSRVRIVDNSGINSYSNLEFGFNPVYENIFVNEVVLRDAAGKVVARADVDDFYVADETADGMADTDKILNVPVPGLEPGHVLEYVVTRQELATRDAFDFYDRLMTLSAPNTGIVVFVRGDPAPIRWKANGDVVHEKHENLLIWHTARPEFVHSEPLLPRLESFLPYLWIADAKASWKAEGAAYLESVNDVIEEGGKRAAEMKELKNISAALTKGADSLSEKVFALSDYVQENLTYTAIEFGRRARIPNPAGLSIANKYGDCKDHSVLLHGLLTAAGIDSHLALISSNSDAREDLPSIDQFNHMIVHVPGLKEAGYIDCTSKGFPSGAIPPENLAEQTVLVLDPEEIHIERIAPYPAEQCLIESEREITVTEEGKRLAVAETLKFHGYYGARVRRYFKNNEPANYKTGLAEMLQRDGTPIVQEVSLENLSENYLPMILHWKYELRRHVTETEGGLAVRWPAVWENYFIAGQPSGERHHPFELSLPLRIVSVAKLLPGEGVRVTSPPSVFGGKSETAFTVAESSARKDAESGVFALSSEFRRKTGRFAAEEYGAYIGALDQGLAIWDVRVKLEKE